MTGHEMADNPTVQRRTFLRSIGALATTATVASTTVAARLNYNSEFVPNPRIRGRWTIDTHADHPRASAAASGLVFGWECRSTSCFLHSEATAILPKILR
jgi:hypothetical protein